VFGSFPETDLRFVINGINGPQNGIAGMLLKPWDERVRSSIKLKPLVQAQLSKIEGVNAFAFNLPPLPGGPGGFAGADGDQFDNGFQSVYEQMLKLKDARARAGCSSFRQRPRLQPAGGAVKIDRSKASDLGITMANIGNTLATLLGGNYVNRFNLEGRSYQSFRRCRATAGCRRGARGYYVATATGSRCRSRPWSRSRRRPIRTR